MLPRQDVASMDLHLVYRTVPYRTVPLDWIGCLRVWVMQLQRLSSVGFHIALTEAGRPTTASSRVGPRGKGGRQDRAEQRKLEASIRELGAGPRPPGGSGGAVCRVPAPPAWRPLRQDLAGRSSSGSGGGSAAVGGRGDGQRPLDGLRRERLRRHCLHAGAGHGHVACRRGGGGHTARLCQHAQQEEK